MELEHRVAVLENELLKMAATQMANANSVAESLEALNRNDIMLSRLVGELIGIAAELSPALLLMKRQSLLVAAQSSPTTERMLLQLFERIHPTSPGN